MWNCGAAVLTSFSLFSGPLTFVRVYAGELRAGQQIYNVSRGMPEKILALFTAFADEMTPTPVVTAGNIAVISGFHSTKSGDTFIASLGHAKSLRHKVKSEFTKQPDPIQPEVAEHDADVKSEVDSVSNLLNVALPSIDIPEPVFFCSIEPPSMGKQKELERALERLEREDPSLRVKINEDTGQTILSGESVSGRYDRIYYELPELNVTFE